MRLAVLLLVLTACGTGPRQDFDEGVQVHFILVRERPPKQDVTLRPIFTVGTSVFRSPPVTFGPDHALAQEAAAFIAPRGSKTRVSFYDPETGTESRDTIDFERALWIVVDLANLGETAEFSIYTRPPNRDLQEWVAHAQITD